MLRLFQALIVLGCFVLQRLGETTHGSPRNEHSYRLHHLTRVVSHDGTFYFLHNGRARLIPDRETAVFLVSDNRIDENNFPNVTDEIFHEFPISTPLESMIRKSNDVDETYRTFGLKWEAYQDFPNLVKNPRWIGYYLNPTIVKWRGRQLFVTFQTGQIGLNWLDNDFKPVNYTYLGVGPVTNFSLGGVVLAGGPDPRCLVVNDDKIVLAYPQYIGSAIWPKYGEIIVNHTTEQLQFGWNVYVKPLSLPSKNWTPFFVDGKIHFIEIIHPLRVVSLPEPAPGAPPDHPFTDNEQLTMVVHPVDNSYQFHWDLGSLRGGTAAKRIGPNRYIALFHSRQLLPNTFHTSYYFGAYVFTNHPTFSILAYSRSPIYHPSFYDGPWDRIRFYEYVVYPTNFYFTDRADNYEITERCSRECLRAHNMTVSMGRQDGDGWIFEMNLLELLETLTHANPGRAEEGAERRRRVRKHR